MKNKTKYILLFVGLAILIPLSLIVGDYLGYRWVQSDSITWSNHKIEINQEGFSAKTMDNGDLVILGLKDNFLLEVTQRKESPTSLLKLHAGQVCKNNDCVFKKEETIELSSQKIPYLYYAMKNPEHYQASYAIESQNIYVTVTSGLSLDKFDSVIKGVISGILSGVAKNG